MTSVDGLIGETAFNEDRLSLAMPTDDSDNRLVVLLLVLVGVLVVLPVLGMGFGLLGIGHMSGIMWGDSMWSGGLAFPLWAFLISVLGQLVFLAVIALGAYLLYKRVTSGDEGADPALGELRRAYARGDLTDEEFERRRERLERESR
jgi:putative membrane protein